MRPVGDALSVYANAVRVGDRSLADLIAQRLFPWVRRTAQVADVSPAARRALERLVRSLGL
jgi:hypothetical protein